VLRSYGAELAVAGGERRLPKLIMLGGLIGVVVWSAWQRGRQPVSDAHHKALSIAAVALGVGAIVAVQWPLVAGPARTALGFVAYAGFHLISPVVYPSPPSEWFSPGSVRDALPGLACLIGVLVVYVLSPRSVRHERTLAFIVLFTIASLIPASSMVGGLRYLYLATAGVSLGTGWLVARSAGRMHVMAMAIVAGALALSATQVVYAGRVWRDAAAVTREGIATMSASIDACDRTQIMLLTAPVGINGVYSNFYFEMFDVLSGCSPGAFPIILRVVGEDAHVDVTPLGDSAIEWRIPNYRGQVMASEDLSNFRISVPQGTTRTVDTAAGRLEIAVDGTSQVFRLTLAERFRGAKLFYYSDGHVRSVTP
jgi:hypothetical protein